MALTGMAAFTALIIALDGSNDRRLERISIALNHLTGVVAGLVRATSKFLAQAKIIEAAGTSPITTRDLGSNKCRPGDTVARYPGAARLCCRRHAGIQRRFAP